MQIKNAGKFVNYLKETLKLVEFLSKNKKIKVCLGDTPLQLSKDLKAAISFWTHKKNIHLYQRKEIPDKLQIGGGKNLLKDFVNLDIFKPADLIWDCRYGLPFPDKSFKFVFCEHFLEHLDYPRSVNMVTAEMYRVLKPGGEILIGVPDGGKVIESYSKKNYRFMKRLMKELYAKREPRVEINGNIDLVNYIFRDQSENPKYTVHYWAYDEHSLKKLLNNHGFRDAKKTSFHKEICNPRRKFYTLYIKAKK